MKDFASVQQWAEDEVDHATDERTSSGFISGVGTV
jgi:hypothetical protein